MTFLRFGLIGGWTLIAAVTLWAIARLGLPAAAATFVGDLGHPWRAQFYADLELHLLLVAGWMVYREPSRPIGVACAALTILLGALFTLPYILIASLRAGGDGRALLTGRGRG